MNVWYMNGAGNDFMVMDARGGTYDFEKLALELCKLTNADGFMAVDHSDNADFRLHFYNSDGSRGEMCGNGARCICRFAYDHGIAGAEMVVQTDAGLVPGWRLSETQYKVKLNNPGELDLERLSGTAYVELGSPGVPHAVFELPGEDLWAHLPELKPHFEGLRRHSAFPKGANVNAYQWVGENEVKVLTFERGVEDYTLACGTGCGSVAATLWSKGLLSGPLLCHNRGGDLTVTVSGENGVIRSILLEGPTEVVRVYEL